MVAHRRFRREAFHTSPQRSHRQYALVSGMRALVEIAGDLHAGHTMGIATGEVVVDRAAVPFTGKLDFMGTPDVSCRRSTADHSIDNHRNDGDQTDALSTRLRVGVSALHLPQSRHGATVPGCSLVERSHA